MGPATRALFIDENIERTEEEGGIQVVPVFRPLRSPSVFSVFSVVEIKSISVVENEVIGAFHHRLDAPMGVIAGAPRPFLRCGAGDDWLVGRGAQRLR